LKGGLALVVGNEGDGVRRLVRDTSDFLLRLPMYGKIESLNAATAGSIAIYEALRQRSQS
ncbi:MAG: TrmH family RNA methyltransferase, partial [Chloroflexota bacterium]